MVDIKKVVEENDRILKNREQELIQKINEVYDKAVRKATEEFKPLEKIDLMSINTQVKRILARTIKVFQDEMKTLVEPIAKATRESYEEGLRETGHILEAMEEEKK